jgi:hypothetical protein
MTEPKYTRFDHLFIKGNPRTRWTETATNTDGFDGEGVDPAVIEAAAVAANPELQEFHSYLRSLRPHSESEAEYVAYGTRSLCVHLGLMEVQTN